MALFDTIRAGASAAEPAFTVDRSLRFNGDDTYLNKTPSALGNRKKWTWSAWVKRSKLGTVQDLFSAYHESGFYNIIRFGSDDQLNFQSNTAAIKETNRVFRDPSAWYHIVVSVNTLNTTAADRVIIYVNGSRETLATDNTVKFGIDFAMNSAQPHTIGVYANGSSYNFDGYMAEINFIDGEQLTPASFGETNSKTGQWNPIEFTGTYAKSGSASDGTTWSSTYANAFAGLPSTSGANQGNFTPLNGTFTITLAGSGVAVSSSLLYQGYGPIASQSTFNQYIDIYVNGTERTCTIIDGSQDGTHAGAHNIAFTGTMTTLRIQSKPTSINGIAQVIVDGNILINGFNDNGKNSFYLQFADNSGTSATTLGKDTSGQSNNYTPNNFSVSAGDGNDSKTDTPTLNKATLNPVTGFTNNATLSEGNLLMSGSSGFKEISTIGVAGTSKFYYELVRTNAAGWQLLGVFIGQPNNPSNALSNSAIWGFASTEALYQGGSYSSSGAPDWGNNNVMGLKYNNGTLQIYKDGTLWGTSITGIPTNDIVFAYIANDNTNAASFVRFSVDDWTQDSAAGVDATWELSTANLPTPTILLPNKHFDTKLWTGNGGTQTISGLSFAPDWVWIKSRSSAINHQLIDTVRGATLRLQSNATTEEKTNTNGLSAFTSDGYTLGDQANVNGSSLSLVGWNWNAGGSTVTNTNGSLSSQVRANTTAGFSIVTYTGAGAARTVGHGLGVVPQAIIVKTRTSGDHWAIYHHNVGNTKILYLNLTNTAATSSNYWNNTTPTSTVFSIGSDNKTGKSGDNYVAYVFSDVDGFSKFGSFVGNGNDDGTFVYTGFRPALIILKATNSARNWVLMDNKRSAVSGANQNDYTLEANNANTENTAGAVGSIDMLSNGFKFRGSAADSNGSGNNYIYLAFAEAPFKNSRAR